MFYNTFLAMPMSLMQAPVTMWAHTNGRGTSYMMNVVIADPHPLMTCLTMMSSSAKSIDIFVFSSPIRSGNTCSLEFKLKSNGYCL